MDFNLHQPMGLGSVMSVPTPGTRVQIQSLQIHPCPWVHQHSAAQLCSLLSNRDWKLLRPMLGNRQFPQPLAPRSLLALLSRLGEEPFPFVGKRSPYLLDPAPSLISISSSCGIWIVSTRSPWTSPLTGLPYCI